MTDHLEGWAIVEPTSRKHRRRTPSVYHYFVGADSLCGKQVHFGPRLTERKKNAGACVKCQEMQAARARRKAKQQ